MEQNAKKKFNIVDVLVIALILAAALFAGWKLTHPRVDSAGTVKVTYKVLCEEVPAEIYESCRQYLPSQLMASGERLDGEILSVESRPCYVLGADGNWAEDPEHVDLIFTAYAMCPQEAVMTTKVGEQEVRVGKKNYILKSEYLEFSETRIIDAQWGE